MIIKVAALLVNLESPKSLKVESSRRIIELSSECSPKIEKELDSKIEVLETIIDKFGGGPVGLDTLAACTGEETTTIEDVYEPYLLQLGFIQRTPRGRIATVAAYEHLDRKYTGK